MKYLLFYLPVYKMPYDHNDYSQLISTVHDQQKEHAFLTKTMMKTVDDQQKTIADQQALINRLSLPVGSQLIVGTTTTTSTSASDVSDALNNLTSTTTTTNITQITGPMCKECNKKCITEKHKSTNNWKKKCSVCLSKRRTSQQTRKRQRPEN